MAAIGWSTPLPFIPGYDFSGEIVGISDDVTDFSMGDAVFGTHWGLRTHTDKFRATAGTFAEYVIIPTRSLVKKPSNMSHAQAAAIAMVGKTATGPLEKATGLGPGSKILVLGGSSGIGSLVIQLAKLKGAWVATTASNRAVNYVSQFGADKIVNYTETCW